METKNTELQGTKQYQGREDMLTKGEEKELSEKEKSKKRDRAIRTE